MTSRVLFGGLALAGAIAFASGARAADLRDAAARRPPAAPVAYAPQVYNWSGFYFGGHVGGGYGASSWSDPIRRLATTISTTGAFSAAPRSAATPSSTGSCSALKAISAGPTSRTKAPIRSATRSTPMCSGPRRSPAGSARRSIVCWFTARAVSRWRRIKSSSDRSSPARRRATSLLRTGWTAGAGLEYALDENWSAKIEYDYLGFGSKAMNFTTPSLGPVSSNSSSQCSGDQGRDQFPLWRRSVRRSSLRGANGSGPKWPAR